MNMNIHKDRPQIEEFNYQTIQGVRGGTDQTLGGCSLC